MAGNILESQDPLLTHSMKVLQTVINATIYISLNSLKALARLSEGPLGQRRGGCGLLGAAKLGPQSEPTSARVTWGTSKKSKGRAELKRSGGGPSEGCVRELSLESEK